MKSVLNCRLVWPHCCHRQWAHYLNWGTWNETETETENSMGERGECTTRSWLHIVYKVWKYLRLYMKTFAYKTVDRWKLWLMIERLNVHNCIQRVRQSDRGGEIPKQLVVLSGIFYRFLFLFFFHYHKIIATSFIEGDLCLAGDRSAFVSSIEHLAFTLARRIWIPRCGYSFVECLSVWVARCDSVCLTGCFISHIESREPLCLAESACGLAWGPISLISRRMEIYVLENIRIRLMYGKANRKWL